MRVDRYAERRRPLAERQVDAAAALDEPHDAQRIAGAGAWAERDDDHLVMGKVERRSLRRAPRHGRVEQPLEGAARVVDAGHLAGELDAAELPGQVAVGERMLVAAAPPVGVD